MFPREQNGDSSSCVLQSRKNEILDHGYQTYDLEVKGHQGNDFKMGLRWKIKQ